MLKVENGVITLTRGDSAYLNFDLTTQGGAAYELQEGDLLRLTVRAQAAEFTAPGVPEAGAQYMPQEQDSFGSALHSMLQKVLQELRPNLREAARSALGVFAGVLAVSVLGPVQEKNNLGMRMVLTLAVSAALLGSASTWWQV